MVVVVEPVHAMEAEAVEAEAAAEEEEVVVEEVAEEEDGQVCPDASVYRVSRRTM